ncbi:LytR/AlgR family response regulator transcription factor [Sphingomonas sp. UYP23]
MRIIVCDDEQAALRRLQMLLEDIPGVELIDATTDPREVLQLIAEGRPDLVLLDIDMPEIDGFDVAEGLIRLGLEPAPLIAFVTSERSLAWEAYERGALDLLPKPVRASRLQLTIERARDALEGREARLLLREAERRLEALEAKSTMLDPAHVWVSRRGETVRVDLDRVERVAAEGAYVRLHVGDRSFLHREAISAIFERLDQRRFVRVHRSHVVRIDHVSAIRRTLHGGGELLLTDGDNIPLGRKFSKEARHRLVDPTVDDRPSVRLTPSSSASAFARFAPTRDLQTVSCT